MSVGVILIIVRMCLLAVGSGGTDRGGEHGGEPASGRSADIACRFTWTIENFTQFNGKKQFSEVFVVGGFKW